MPDGGVAAVQRARSAKPEAVTRSVVRACQDFLIRDRAEPAIWLRAVRDEVTDIDGLLALMNAMPASTLELREAALAATEQAVATCRHLAEARPDAFLPDLALSLNNLSNRLADLGRREAALAAIEEAVASYRHLAEARPDAFLPDLAMALNTLSLRLAERGRREAALAAIEEAVAIRRQLAEARPDAFLPNLAKSLMVHGYVLKESEPAAAAGSFAEGIAVLRDPFLSLPAAFAQLMLALCQDYLQAQEAAGLAPDEDLLAPIIPMLEPFLEAPAYAQEAP
ncbi:tetratricopeptide repeat protein [Paracraurococcus ruber]|nr:tetratricopeptide repeat protein [Paracraurococcus ruber]